MPLSKGVSPVIASILLVLVAVSLAGMYTLWVNRVASGVAEQGEEGAQQALKNAFSALRIDSASKQSVHIKNVGSTKLGAAALSVLYDGQPIEYVADFTSLEPDESGTLILQKLWKYGAGNHTVRVSAGTFSDERRVTATPSPGVIGDWRFEEGSGTTAGDSSGGGNAGTLTGGPVWQRDTAASSKFAIRFDGSDDRVTLPGPTSSTNAFTWEAWIRPTAVSNDQMFLGPNLAGVNNAFYFRILSSTLFVSVQTTVAQRTAQAPSGILSNGQWYHAVATYDGTTLRIYKDGAEVVSSQIGETLTTWGFGRVGRWIDSDTRSFTGLIDEVRIYNKAYEPDTLLSLRLA